jgi:hypothetical protein
VQQQVHLRQPRGAVHQLDAGDRAGPQTPRILGGQLLAVMLADVVVRGEQEAARSTGRVHDRVAGFRPHAAGHRVDERTRGEVLPGPGLDVLGALLQQRLVCVALDVDASA